MLVGKQQLQGNWFSKLDDLKMLSSVHTCCYDTESCHLKRQLQNSLWNCVCFKYRSVLHCIWEQNLFVHEQRSTSAQSYQHQVKMISSYSWCWVFAQCVRSNLLTIVLSTLHWLPKTFPLKICDGQTKGWWEYHHVDRSQVLNVKRKGTAKSGWAGYTPFLLLLRKGAGLRIMSQFTAPRKKG